jgi:hypothetical protein
LYLYYLEAVLLSSLKIMLFFQLALQDPIYLCLVLLIDLLHYEVSTVSNCSFTHSCYIPCHLILLDLINRIIEEYKSSILCTYHPPPPLVPTDPLCNMISHTMFLHPARSVRPCSL